MPGVWHKDKLNWHGGVQFSLVFGKFSGGSLETESGQILQFSGKEEECSYFVFIPWEIQHRITESTGTRYSLQMFAHSEVVMKFIKIK